MIRPITACPPFASRALRPRVVRRVVDLCASLVVALAAGCASNDGRATITVAAPASAPALAFKLDSGPAVFVPACVEHTEQVDVVVHFHGVSSVTEREFAAADVRAVLITVNFPGLSAAYERPMSEPGRFAGILSEAMRRLVEQGRLPAEARWRRVCVSSFSAGFGAVRALLRQDGCFDRIDALLLADTVYAGYAETDGVRRPDPAHMEPFRRFASLAVEGRKTVFVTHSYLVPGGYAGTHETADDLIASVGASRVAGDDADAPPPLRVISRADAGCFHVRGCAGDTGEDHMQHLRNLRWGLGQLLLDACAARDQ